jgi:uncharacterized protein (TIGR03084 family)
VVVVDAIVAALAEQHSELADLLDGLGEPDWERETSLPGWTVADVVLHLAQTDELALGSARGRFGEALDGLAGGITGAESVDDGAAAMVARERGRPPAEVHERWRTGAGRLRETLASCAPDLRLTWVAGELSARTLATTRLAETWIHTGDVAGAVGATVSASDRLWHVARLAWRTLPYAFSRDGAQLAGPVAFELRAPSGAAWEFTPDEPAVTVVRGDALELCRVAARRVDPARTGLRAEGPDAAAVLRLVRTYA